MSLFDANRDLVFIDLQRGVSKNDKSYCFVKVADPTTFENFTMSCDPHKSDFFTQFGKGEKVRLGIDLADFYGKANVIVTDIKPAAQVK